MLININFIKGALKKLWSLSPEALWVFVGQVGTAIAGLLGVKMLTNVLGPREFGMLALANTLVALISTNFLFGPLGQGIMRMWSISKERGDLGAFYAALNRYGRYAISASILLTFALVAVVIPTKGIDWAALLAISMAVGIASGWLGLRISVLTASRQRQRVAFLDIGNAFLRPIIATLLVLMIAVSALWAMAGYLMATFGVVVFAERFYRRIVSDTAPSTFILNHPVSPVGKIIISYSWPFAIWGIFGWIHMSCDRWSLQTFYGAEVVGAFAVISQLATFPVAFGSGFLSVLFTPIAFQRAGDIANRQNVASANKILGGLTCAFILGVVILVSLFSVFHYSLVVLISNIQYAKFSFLLPWLTVAWAFFYLGQLLCTFGLLANRPQIYILPKLLSSIIATIGTFYLSAEIGPSGVIWGLTIAGLVYAIWCTIIAWKLILDRN